ncbi:MAG: hemin uptake protein HemP [Rubrivivax sp.]|jgi:hemin uptake protein HemP|nr:hemin uptake protein HemP [Rubrivivax sp.]
MAKLLRLGGKPASAGLPALGHVADPTAAAHARLASARRWRSAELFGAAHEIEIEHGHAVYRLRLTALGKLILTK